MEEQETPKDLAPMKAQVYKDPRPVEYFARFHERSRSRDPDWVYEAVRIVTTIYAWIFFRTRGIAADKVRGIGPVALMSGAPVVPVAIHGSSKVRNWKRLQFPKITVRYGDPIVWDRVEDPTKEQQQAVAEEIFAEIRALYAELEAEGRKGVARRVRELRRAERA